MTGRSADERLVPGSPDLVGVVDEDALQANQLGVFVIGKIRNGLRQFRLAGAELYALLPRHLVEVAVVQHQNDEPRIGPSPSSISKS